VVARRVVGRRAVLVGAAAVSTAVAADLVFTHNSSGHARLTPAPHATPSSDPTMRAAAQTEQRLIAAYTASIRAHPGLAGVLAVPLAHHRAHLAAFGQTPSAAPTTNGLLAGPLTAAAAGAPRAGPHPPVCPGCAAPPAAQRAALQTLVGQESAASRSYAAAAVSDLAHGGLLASVSAAEAVHADLLTTAIASVHATVVPSTPTPTPTPTHTPTAMPTVRPTPTPTPSHTVRHTPAPTRSTTAPPTTHSSAPAPTSSKPPTTTTSAPPTATTSPAST
jgi:hypothetical protein